MITRDCLQQITDALDSCDQEGIEAVVRAAQSVAFCTDAIHSHETGDSMTKKSGKPGSKPPGAPEYGRYLRRCIKSLESPYNIACELAYRMEKESR